MLKIQTVKLTETAKIPTRAHETDAGYDLYADEASIINPLEFRMISTGISMAIPKGYFGHILPRSGLAVKKGIQIMAGVIDSGYRGEIKVVLYNACGIGLLSEIFNSRKDPTASSFSTMFGFKDKFCISPGDRIAQIVFKKCENAEFEEVNSLEESERKTSGFGSSGI